MHCHGGKAVCQAILQSLQRAGCRLCSPTELTTAIRLGEPKPRSPIVIAAEQDLICAPTDLVAKILLDQLNGCLTRELISIIGLIADEEFSAAQTRLQILLKAAQWGTRLNHPWNVVLIGPPNVGKSSLLNALSGLERSIVHEEAGTTRDYVDVCLAIQGWPVRIIDTAGIRDTTDEIESAGIRQTERQIADADLIIFVVDATCEIQQLNWMEMVQAIAANSSPDDSTRVSVLQKVKMMVAWNKIDLLSDQFERLYSFRNQLEPHQLSELRIVPCHAAAGENFDSFRGVRGVWEAIVELFEFPAWQPGIPVPFRQIQVEAI
ncbi:MAG: GTP-binding protein, partial [Planctomycetales bacterium]|nr:GTP-binding protein [Planctomycetales bacterium]